MKVTPLDLRQQRFRKVFRGYDPAEVVALLTEVADQYEQSLRETDRLQTELGRMEGLLAEHREHERNLRNTLLTAQKLADEIKQNAENEAKRVVREAEGRAELVLQKAQARVEEIQKEIDSLKLKRRDVETSIESVMGALRNTLDFVHQQDQKDREEKILLHRPRPAEPVAAALRPLEAAPAPERKVQG